MSQLQLFTISNCYTLATHNILTVLLEYNDLSIWHLKHCYLDCTNLRGMLQLFQQLATCISVTCLLVMSELCSKFTYYASILLNALACLLCLKLYWHNWRRPTLKMKLNYETGAICWRFFLLCQHYTECFSCLLCPTAQAYLLYSMINYYYCYHLNSILKTQLII